MLPTSTNLIVISQLEKRHFLYSTLLLVPGSHLSSCYLACLSLVCTLGSQRYYQVCRKVEQNMLQGFQGVKGNTMFTTKYGDFSSSSLGL